MFIEVNEIKGFIVNIDSFLDIKASKQLKRSLIWSAVNSSNIKDIRISKEAKACLAVLSSKFPFRIVSKLSKDQVQQILKINSIPINSEHIFASDPDKDFAKIFMFFKLIKQARDDMGLLSCYCVYFTAEHDTIHKALSLHLGTMILKFPIERPKEEEDLYRSGADFIIDSAEDFENIVTLKYAGYIAEYRACPPDMIGQFPKSVYIQFFCIPNQDMPEDRIFVAGRYFPKSKDSRHFKHPLSIRIINSKSYSPRHKDLFAALFYRCANEVSEGKYDLITRVPPRPSERSNDRFKTFLEAIPSVVKGYDKTKIAPDIIECLYDYPKQKDLGYEARKRNVQGAFQVKGNVKGKTIVLIDDILTTGATLYEITKAFQKAGCKKVYPIALSVTVANQFSEGNIDLLCTACGGTLTPRCNSKTGNVFWGCSNYSADDKTKHDILNFSVGVRRLNENDSPIEQDIPEDIDIAF